MANNFTGTASGGPSSSQPNVTFPTGLRTYQDAVDHLVNFTGGNPIDASQRLTRTAVQNAYLRLINERSWQYLYTSGQVALVAPYSTGTIAFDLTGGSSERLLTLSGGTWPTWAKFGRVRIEQNVYEVESRLGNTTLQLKAGLSPGADIAAGTGYTLFRSVYSLPVDLKRLTSPHNKNTWWSGSVGQQDQHWLESRVNDCGDPVRWTIAADPDITGTYALYVQPYPSQDLIFDFIYQRNARPLFYSGYETAARAGTVTVSANSSSVAGTNTTFTSAMEGSIIRFGTSALHPDGLGGLNPFTEQRKILSVTNATTLILDTPVSSAKSAVKYVVTDPIDLPETFWNAMIRACEWEYSLTGRGPKPDQAAAHYKDALVKAKESDSVMEVTRCFNGVGGMGPYQFYRPGNVVSN